MQRYRPTIHEYPDHVAKAAMVEDSDRGEYYHRADVDALFENDSVRTKEYNLLVQESRTQAWRIDELEKALRFASCYVPSPGWSEECSVRQMRTRIEAALRGVVRFSDTRA